MGVCGENKNTNKLETNKLTKEENQDFKNKKPTEPKKGHKSKVKIKTKSDLKNEIKQELKSELKKELKTASKKEKESEAYTGRKKIPIKIVNKVLESICKITVKTKKGKLYGTGFFMNCSDKLKCLMTNYHVINPSVENENIEIEIYNKKKMKLEFNNRYTKYIERPKDIAMIEIKENDEIYNDIIFLDYDNNYTKRGYSIYKDVDVFSVEHPY